MFCVQLKFKIRGTLIRYTQAITVRSLTYGQESKLLNLKAVKLHRQDKRLIIHMYVCYLLKATYLQLPLVTTHACVASIQ